MEKFRPQIETEIFLPEEWYLNDDAVSEIYMKLENNELSEETIKHIFYEVDEVLRDMLKVDKEKLTSKQLDEMTRLNNVAREIYKHFPHSYEAPKRDDSDAIEISSAIH